MSLYRVMLVDDEEEIRDGIRRKIDWKGNGFELVASAENGQEALELAEQLHPDVVMTDIKMPFMDGLTLGKRLCELMPDTKLVIFSGFDDFEYAQKAIQMGAAEYILKPINAAELTAVLQRLKSQLDAEFAEKRNIALLRQRYQSSLPLLREQFYARLLDGRITERRAGEQAEQYGIDLSGRSCSPISTATRRRTRPSARASCFPSRCGRSSTRTSGGGAASRAPSTTTRSRSSPASTSADRCSPSSTA